MATMQPNEIITWLLARGVRLSLSTHGRVEWTPYEIPDALREAINRNSQALADYLHEVRRCKQVFEKASDAYGKLVERDEGVGWEEARDALGDAYASLNLTRLNELRFDLERATQSRQAPLLF